MKVYLDNAATTRLSSIAFESMVPYLKDNYGNPSSLHDLGQKSRKAVEHAREIIAESINASPEEIYFTSGGTESNNLVMSQNKKGVPYTIISPIEHHSIMNSGLAYSGLLYILGVDEYGFVNMDELSDVINQVDVSLISVMFANNEIGTIESIKDIGEIAKKNNILFHTDAVQAYGHIPIDVKDLNIDFMSASAHKLNGPKGIGFIYINKNLNMTTFPLLFGGEQERGIRAGTENVPAIVGFGTAVEQVMEHMEEWTEYETSLRDYLIERVLTEIPKSHLNGSFTNRLPGNTNFYFEDIDGEELMMMLNEAGIYCSTGSACSSGDPNPSHVLKAIGLEDKKALGSLRLTLNHENTREEIDYTVDKLKEIVKWIRDNK